MKEAVIKNAKQPKHWAPVKAIILLLAIISALPSDVRAQSIVLDTNDVENMLNNMRIKEHVILVDSLNIRSFGKARDQSQKIQSQVLTKLLLSVIIQRLSATHALELTTEVSNIVPDIIAANPFEKAITLQHLIQETAGFATPPSVLEKSTQQAPISAGRLKKFLIKLRSADQLSVHDPAGWALIIHVIEALTKTPLPEAVTQHFMTPLGLSAGSLTIGYNTLSGTDMPVTFVFTQESAATLIRLVLRNKMTPDGPYLPRKTYNDWRSETNAHSIHPAALKSTGGLSLNNISSRTIVSGLNASCDDELGFAAFPNAGSAILVIRDNSSSACPDYTAQHVAKEISQTLFPPISPDRASRQLAEPSTLSGRYINASTTPSWLTERLNQMQTGWLTVSGNPQNTLTLQGSDKERTDYQHVSPYVFEANGEAVNRHFLFFSPYKLGGYILKDGTPYRRIDSLGLAALYEHMVPLLLATLLSGALYIFTVKDRAWRNMGWFAVSGASLVATGLYLELNAWPYVLYEYDQPWLINLWRTGLNIGLMAALTLPMFTVVFSRANKIPNGAMEPLIKIHLLLMSAASMTLMLMLVSWGIAGTFSAY